MKIKLLFIILICSHLFANCQTIIPGGAISGTWTLTGSPYLIQGAIMIPNDSILTIEPGVIVEFQGSYKFLILGQLLAIGNSTDSISFTAADTTTGWLGIRFENTVSTNDTSKIYFCKIQYGKATSTSPNNCGGGFYFNNFSKTIISNSCISNCSANSDGGGIYCINSSPYISTNSIKNNSAYSGGGGIYCNNSSPLIIDNTISYNTANDGAAIACEDNSAPFITNNIISNNTAPNSCGGIRCNNSSPIISYNTISYNTANMEVCSVSAGGIVCDGGNQIITNNTITNNSTAGHGGGGIFCTYSTTEISNNTITYNIALKINSGGGIKCGYSSNTSITNNIITNNISSGHGGGIYYSSDEATISYNIIANNTAAVFGGGICCDGYSTDISNNVISNNTADVGGGIYCTEYTGNFISNTITNNSAQYGGALFCTSSSNPIFQNAIFWGNTATVGNQIYLDDDESDPDFYYCDVQGGTTAFGLNSNVFYLGIFQNNIDADPLFVSPSSGSGTGYNGVTADWSLQSISPCIDAGDPSSPLDPDGTVADIGAFYFNQSQVSQQVFLNSGFSFVSSHIIPDNPDMLIVMATVLNENLDFVRNSQGQTLRKIGPNWVNGIGDWFATEGYLIKMFTDDSFIIEGDAVDPATPISVATGFQFVSYFPETPMNALLAFETIIGDDLDFIRNSQGQTIRKIGPNWVNGIGDCQSGEGYLVKMFADGEIVYPMAAKSSGKINIFPIYFSLTDGNPAEPVYTIYAKGFSIGDEIGVYNGEILAGSGVVVSDNILENAIPVFSNLYKAGNKPTIKAWDKSKNKEYILNNYIFSNPYGDAWTEDVFPEEDGEYSLMHFSTTGISDENMINNISIYPNPSKGIFNISLEGIEDNIQIKVLDLRGKEISNLELSEAVSTKLDLTELVAGIYFISFSGKDFSEVKKIVIK